MGRIRVEIDWDVVDEKLSNFCDGTEVAAFLGIHFNTLERRIRQKFNCDFGDYKSQKRAIGEATIRELQMKSAKKGNVAMLIWLGKQYLGQTDKTDHTSKGDRIQPVEITVAKEGTTNRIKKLIDESMLN